MGDKGHLYQLYVIFAAVLWGTCGTAQAFAPEGVNPVVVGAVRIGIGGIGLFLIGLFKGAFKEKFRMNKKDLFIGAICIALYQPLFFVGITKTGVAFGTVLTLGSAPIFSGIIEYFCTRKVDKVWLISTVVSVSGCVLLFAGQGEMKIEIVGSVLCLTAGFFYSVFVKKTQELFESNSRFMVNAVLFMISGTVLIPSYIMYDASWIITLRGGLVALYLGIVTFTIPLYFFTKGLAKLATPEAVTLTLAEPLTAAILGTVLLREKLSIISIVGIVMLFVGLIINSKPKKISG